MRWRTTHREYADSPAELGWTAARSPDGHYGLRILHSNSGDFLAQADPRGAQQTDECGVFAISAQGPVYLAPYADSDCWNR
jgi:Tfp pilus assembly protein PilE